MNKLVRITFAISAVQFQMQEGEASALVAQWMAGMLPPFISGIEPYRGGLVWAVKTADIVSIYYGDVPNQPSYSQTVQTPQGQAPWFGGRS